MALTLAHAPNDSQAARILKSRAANWRENSGGLLCAKAPLRRRTDQLELPKRASAAQIPYGRRAPRVSHVWWAGRSIFLKRKSNGAETIWRRHRVQTVSRRKAAARKYEEAANTLNLYHERDRNYIETASEACSSP
jgi:hypothetical protein